jgi:hypothetical protein
MTQRQEQRDEALGPTLVEPLKNQLTTANELRSLAADARALAEQVDCPDEKNRLLRAASALDTAAEGNDVRWLRLGDVTADLVKRLRQR